MLAAEEFGIGTRDERFPADPSGISEPHDILAAEEFGIGTRDERFPGDPTGLDEPHDVLAAEEFPMPVAGRARGDARTGLRAWLPLLVLLVALAGLAVVRRRGSAR